MKNIRIALLLSCLTVVFGTPPDISAQTTAFTYQGRLTDSNGPVTGLHDFEFRLFNAVTGGAQQGSTIALNDLGVTNGLFVAPIDFGANFPGADRFLQISVRPGASAGVFTPLNPRQPITSTPYAVTARGISGPLPAGQLPSNVALTDRAQTFSANQTFQRPTTFDDRVGIGTNIPQQALHVAGSYVRVDGSGNEQATLGGDGAGSDVELGSSNPGIGAVALFNQGNGDYMHLFAKGATFFGPISGDGSGLTALPAGQLSGSLADALLSPNVALRAGGNSFTGDQTFADRVFFGNQTRQTLNLYNADYGIGVQANAAYFRTANEFLWYRGGSHSDDFGDPGTGGGSLMRLGSSGDLLLVGRLGIGTTTPGTELDVVATQALGRLTSTNASNGSVLIFNNQSPLPDYLGAINFENDGSTVGQIAYLANDRFAFRAGGVERMRLDGNGQLTVFGQGANGVQGNSASTSASGVYGQNSSGGGFGVAGRTTGAGYAIYGDNTDPAGWAGVFNGNVYYSGLQNKLDVGDNFVATVRAGDFFLGHSSRRGTPGRALVDLTDTLHLNFDSDWAKTVIGGNNVSVCTLTIRGGCDIAEPFKMSDAEIPKGAVVVIDENNPGHLRMSDQACDRRVAGIISGANGVNTGVTLTQEGVFENGQNVALSGRVYVQADTANGPIVPGDLLTTSETPGHAMKVTDHAKSQGAILGKAMTPLKDGKGMVLVLVTLQ